VTSQKEEIPALGGAMATHSSWNVLIVDDESSYAGRKCLPQFVRPDLESVA
jgi:hypothetical protein